ncbi:MAG TPA: fructosamine kinase family protein [Atopostipes sp.]|nr:fructosamine kinase family protein [Atopostipes sp.]
MNEQWLSQLPIENIQKVTKVSGGDVNDAYAIQGKDQKYFLLVQPHTKKEFFVTEVAGLKDMKQAGITVPEVYDYGEIDGDAYLLISYLDEGQTGSYQELAKMIAKMHESYSSNGLFGYPYPYQGADITFNNDWTDRWIELFVERRLDKLHEELVKRNKWNQHQANTYQEVRKIILKELSKHQSVPSLLHGDLWGGNHMFLKNGEPALFDPAPMYGDREFDIGVTTSFGGYPHLFYEAYQEILPMAEGYEKRLPFYRLYVFMVHLHKFGGIYENRVDQTMQEILS